MQTEEKKKKIHVCCSRKKRQSSKEVSSFKKATTWAEGRLWRYKYYNIKNKNKCELWKTKEKQEKNLNINESKAPWNNAAEKKRDSFEIKKNKYCSMASNYIVITSCLL